MNEDNVKETVTEEVKEEQVAEEVKEEVKPSKKEIKNKAVCNRNDYHLCYRRYYADIIKTSP